MIPRTIVETTTVELSGIAAGQERFVALDLAVSHANANCVSSTDEVVQTAEKFHSFLTAGATETSQGDPR
jgi:hypothetical protein